MALHFRQLEGLFFTRQDGSSLIRILVEYATLRQKIENPSGQSYYFKRGLESRQKRLVDLTKEFTYVKETFNMSTIDTLLEKINENLEGKRHYEKYGMNTIQQMHYSKIISENEFLRELIRLKSKTKSLQDIDFYLENPEEFLVIFE